MIRKILREQSDNMVWKVGKFFISACGMLLSMVTAACGGRFVPPAESGAGGNLLNVIELELKQKNPAEAAQRAGRLLRTRFDELVAVENRVTRSVGAMVYDLLLSQRPAIGAEYTKLYGAQRCNCWRA